jgi:hypothetical protein
MLRPLGRGFDPADLGPRDDEPELGHRFGPAREQLARLRGAGVGPMALQQIAEAPLSGGVDGLRGHELSFSRSPSRPSESWTKASPPVMPAPKLRPNGALLATPSTTAAAPELRTANRSPAEPAQYSSPAVAP